MKKMIILGLIILAIGFSIYSFINEGKEVKNHEGHDGGNHEVDHENMTKEEHKKYLEEGEHKKMGKLFEEKSVKVTNLTENKSFHVKEGEQEFIVTVGEETVVINNLGEKTEIKEGDEITYYNNTNKVMTMQYPPNYHPELIIVNTKEVGNYKHLFITEDGMDIEKTMKVNMEEPIESYILEEGFGESKMIRGLMNKEVIVFYDITTKSIPPQTTPNKMIILN